MRAYHTHSKHHFHKLGLGNSLKARNLAQCVKRIYICFYLRFPKALVIYVRQLFDAMFEYNVMIIIIYVNTIITIIIIIIIMYCVQPNMHIISYYTPKGELSC